MFAERRGWRMERDDWGRRSKGTRYGGEEQWRAWVRARRIRRAVRSHLPRMLAVALCVGAAILMVNISATLGGY